MDDHCVQCPPVDFLSHELCHTQFYRFQTLCRELEENLENINPSFLDIFKQWRTVLISLFQFSSTDEQYHNYGIQFQEFNTFFSLLLQGLLDPLQHERIHSRFHRSEQQRRGLSERHQ